MIVALLFLSLAMIVGGLWAMVLGWNIVLVERGWTMVIAGSVSASGGAILLGLVAVVSRLARVQAELATLGNRAEADQPHPSSPVIDPVSLLSSGLMADADSQDARVTTKADEPMLPLFGGDEREAVEAPPAMAGPEGTKDGKEGRAPASSMPAETQTADAKPGPSAPEGPFAEEAGVKATEEDENPPEGARPEWARDQLDEDLPVQAPAASDSAERPAVIGTYDSGGNRYVMFADGSIEAETPEGVFRFASLDELKEFIATGGEPGSAGA